MIGILTLLAVGCSSLKSGGNQKPGHTHNTTQPQIKISKKPVDGALASIQQIKTYQSHTGTGVKEYKLFYWSNGYKVEAFLTKPAKSGKYPLLVNLHGGASWRGGVHSSLGYTARQAAYLSNDHTIMLYPEYEGYMDSQGKEMGIKTDTDDVKNAIAAITSMGKVKSDDTYLEGYSLGGGLALMTAAQDRNLKAVVAVSPFVGLSDFMKWAKVQSLAVSFTNK